MAKYLRTILALSNAAFVAACWILLCAAATPVQAAPSGDDVGRFGKSPYLPVEIAPTRGVIVEQNPSSRKVVGKM